MIKYTTSPDVYYKTVISLYEDAMFKKEKVFEITITGFNSDIDKGSIFLDLLSDIQKDLNLEDIKIELSES